MSNDFDCAYTDPEITGRLPITYHLLRDTGYLPEHIPLVARYTEMTGCLRHFSARHPEDKCARAQHHLMHRTYQPLPITLNMGGGNAISTVLYL